MSALGERMPDEIVDLLRLEPVLDLKAAGGLHRDLIDRRGRDVVIDASAVSRLGGQCLQVLIAGHHAWRADGRTLSIASPSANFLQALDLFGFVLDGDIHKERRP